MEVPVTLSGSIEIPDITPAPADDLILFINGVGMSALVGDQKLNDLAYAFHAEYRNGILVGSLRLESGPAKQVQQGPLMIRFDGLPWRYGGLQVYTPGIAHYEERVTGLYRAGMARFISGKLRFFFPSTAGKLREMGDGVPGDWHNEGMILSWMVAVP